LTLLTGYAFKHLAYKIHPAISTDFVGNVLFGDI